MSFAFLRTNSALGFGALMFLAGAPAAAQSAATAPQIDQTDDANAAAPAADAFADGDIIVTAQRRAESLSRIGVTVSVVSADTMTSQGVRSPADLTRFVPGFQASQSYNGNPVYTLRGIGFNSPNANTTAPVGLYLDEVAVPYPYMSLGLVHDLERVEVLKGPQGTLYGRNATGGLVNFVTAKPTNEPAAGIVMELGNYQTINVNAYASGPLGSGFRARVSGSTQNRNEGYQQSVTRDDTLGVRHQHAVRATIDYVDNSPFSLVLTGNYWKRTGDTTALQSIRYLPAVGNPLARASVIANPTSNRQADWLSVTRQPQADIGIFHPGPLTDSRFFSGTAKAAYEFSDSVELASLTTYQDLRTRDGSDLGGFQIQANFQDVRAEITSFSQELRLIGTGDRLNWSVGGYYAKDTSKQNQIGYNDENAQIATLRGLSLAVNDGRYTAEQIMTSFGNYQSKSDGSNKVLSAFANVDYQISDQFKVTLGGRYTEDTQQQDSCTYDYRGTNIPVINLFYGYRFGQHYDLQPGQCYTLQAGTTDFVDGVVSSYQKQSNFAWRANVEFTPSDTTLLYATISRGYKAGGFPLVAASSSAQFEPVRQEQLTAYEIGTKLGLFDRAMQLNVSAFYYDYKDKQIFGRVADVIFGTLSRIDNIPKSRQFGVEADATIRITPELRLNMAGVYLNSKIEEYSGYNQFSQFQNFSGNPYPYTPEFQGNALLAYDQPVTDTLNINGTIAVSYQSKTNASASQLPDFKIDGYALAGITFGVAAPDGEWSVQGYVNNLFDKYYWVGVESATDSVFRFAGMPRQFGVRLGFKF